MHSNCILQNMCQSTAKHSELTTHLGTDDGGGYVHFGEVDEAGYPSGPGPVGARQAVDLLECE